jgi:hypothetical protein
MTRDELRGHVADVLAAPLSDSQTLRELKSRVNGADLNQLLVAALSVAREQVSQKIAELELALDVSEEDRWQLEDQMQELRDRTQNFARKSETKGKRT